MRNQELINPNIAPKIDKPTKIKCKLFNPLKSGKKIIPALDIKEN